jgi:hypothetical protein
MLLAAWRLGARKFFKKVRAKAQRALRIKKRPEREGQEERTITLVLYDLFLLCVLGGLARENSLRRFAQRR